MLTDGGTARRGVRFQLVELGVSLALVVARVPLREVVREFAAGAPLVDDVPDHIEDTVVPRGLVHVALGLEVLPGLLADQQDVFQVGWGPVVLDGHVGAQEAHGGARRRRYHRLQPRDCKGV